MLAPQGLIEEAFGLSTIRTCSKHRSDQETSNPDFAKFEIEQARLKLEVSYMAGDIKELQLMQKQGIYLMPCNNLFSLKIGYTKNLDARGSGSRIHTHINKGAGRQIAHLIYGRTRDFERELHQWLGKERGHKRHGESDEDYIITRELIADLHARGMLPKGFDDEQFFAKQQDLFS